MLMFIGFIIAAFMILGLASGLSSLAPLPLKAVVWVLCAVIEYNFLSYGYNYCFPQEENVETADESQIINNVYDTNKTNTSETSTNNNEVNDERVISNYPHSSNIYNEQPEIIETPPSSNPEPKPCSACKQSGECSCVRDGHPGKQRSPLSMTTEEPVYETHQYCKGTGKCPACGGDGQLDYGVDY